MIHLQSKCIKQVERQKKQTRNHLQKSDRQKKQTRNHLQKSDLALRKYTIITD